MQQPKLNAAEKMEKAYFELLENCHYSKITVSAIIEKAGISRTTFYRHYVDVLDMHEKIAKKFSNNLIEECLKSVILKKAEEGYMELIRIFTSQDKYIRLMCGKNGSRYFLESIYVQATEKVFPLLVNLSEDQLFRLKFMCAAAVATYVKNILEDRPFNLEFIDICKKLLVVSGFSGGCYGK